MVPLGEAAALLAAPPELLELLELELLAATAAGVLVALGVAGLALLELGAAAAVLPLSLEPPQPASAMPKPMARPGPNHAPIVRLLLFMSLASLLEG
jgi:hypothetical protein